MSQKKAIFNNGQSGSLPPISYARDTAALDPVAGAYAGINVPYYGKSRARLSFQDWTQLSTDVSYNWGLCGFDRDGVTPMACAKQLSGSAAEATLKVWIGSPIIHTAEDYEIDIERETSITLDGVAAQSLRDIFEGDAGQTAEAFWPVGGVCLPGCFVFLCTRYVETTTDNWDSEGITLVSLQHTAAGAWVLTNLGNVNDSALVSGSPRGSLWAMAAYYPNTLNQNPINDVWLTPTDYAGTDDKYGGQCGIIRATRASVAADWVFQDIYMLLEETVAGVHFHGAAWTPNGVVLSRGDNPDINENVLFTCSDWDDYTNAGNWTTTRDAYGSRTPDLEKSYQWMGPLPHSSDLNKVIVGADEDNQHCSVMSVSAGGAITYENGVGDMAFDTDEDMVGFPANKPNAMTPKSVRAMRAGDPIFAPHQRSRFLYSDNDSRFAIVALYPSTAGASSFAFLYGNTIVFMQKGAGGSVHTMPVPSLTDVQGLVVAPGGANVFEGTLVGLQQENDTIVADGGETGPDPTGVVHRCVAGTTPAANRIGFWNCTPASTVAASAAAWAIFFVKSNTNAGVSIAFTTETIPQGTGDLTYNPAAAVHANSWRLLPIPTDAGSYDQDPYTPRIRLLNQTSPSNLPVADYHMQFQGWYTCVDECPYLMDTDTSGSNMQIEQTLSAISGTDWTIGIELFAPVTGIDFVSGRTVVLATIYQDANDYIEISYDATNTRISVVVTDNGTPQAAILIPDIYIRKDDQIWIVVGSDGTNTHVWACSGGFDENGLTTDSAAVAMTGNPVSVRMGDNDFTQVPNTELSMITIDDAALLADPKDMMARHSEGGGKFGPRNALDWFKDRLATEIN